MAERRFRHREVTKLYNSIQADDYGFTEAEHRVLITGLTALDNSMSAQEEIDMYGMTTVGRFENQLVANPAVQIARQERAQFLAAFKQLGLADPYGGDSKQGRGAQGARTK